MASILLRWKYISIIITLAVLMISIGPRSLLSRHTLSSLGFLRQGLKVKTTSSVNPEFFCTTTTPLFPAMASSAEPQQPNMQPEAQAEALQPPAPKSTAPPPPKKEEAPALPKLSAADYRAYNRLAVQMDAFHNHFRATWNAMYRACEENKRPAGMSIRQFLRMGLDFCHHLETHHTIEEHYVFPELAVKMPLFRQRDHLLGQHAQIHRGLEGFEKYLTKCQRGETELRMEEMKALMDGFGKVLWSHLDDEVEQLSAENMRKFWTREEMNRIGVSW